MATVMRTTAYGTVWAVALSAFWTGCTGSTAGPVDAGVTADTSLRPMDVADAAADPDTGAADGTSPARDGGVCSGATAFFCDDYSSSALASAYSTFNGTWTRNTGDLTVVDTNAWERARALLAQDVDTFDVTIVARSAGDSGFGLIYNASADANDGYAVLVHPAQFQGVYLKQLVPGGADVELGSFPLASRMPGTSLTLRVTRVGTTVTVYLDGTQVLQADDHGVGGHGRLGLVESTTDMPSGAGATFTLFEVNSESLSGRTTGDAGMTAPDDGGTTGGVHAAPTGPAAPASGWHVAFADDFNAPLGTGAGQDDFWYPNQPFSAPDTDADGDNGYEAQVYNASQVRVSAGHLLLTAQAQANRRACTGNCSGSDDSNRTRANYVSGLVATPTNIAGYTGFTWTPNHGETWAFEIVCQFPLDTGELFNAWWTSSQDGWTNERDFFEGHTATGVIDTDWIYNPGVSQDYYTSAPLAFDPSAAMHRYTYVVRPDQSWSLFIDGVMQSWVNGSGNAPARTSDDVAMELIIDYALSTTTFTSGSRDFVIDSVAVYQDGAHAGRDTRGGGVAPGTIVR